MSLSKLKKLHVIIIGSVLCAVAAVAMFFLLIKPEQEKYRSAYSRWETAEKVGNAQAQAAAEADLDEAQAERARAQQTLDVQMARRMPNLDFSNREAGMIALWREQILHLGPMLESFAQDRSVNVLKAEFQLPPPPANPNDPVFDQDVLVFPLGTVNVQGNFRDLMNNVRRWNNCKRLVMIGPPVLAGQSPRLQMAYTVTCYVYPLAKGGPPVSMAGTAAAQPGGTTAPMMAP